MHTWQMPARFASAAHLHRCEACREEWVASFKPAQRLQAAEALRLADDALLMLDRLEREVSAVCRVGLFDANSDGDDIFVSTASGRVCIPCLRRQQVAEGETSLCLADFVRPFESKHPDRIGVFATTIGFDPVGKFSDDPYRTLLAQTLCDRLAEAAACVFHREVRRSIWGYAPDENLTVEQLLFERNQGIRPAVGYPSLPDQSINFILSEMIDMEGMGIKLTENGAMSPHATVTGLMVAYPHASYFAVGQIDDEQLGDYAHRRGLPIDVMRRFLSHNLNVVKSC